MPVEVLEEVNPKLVLQLDEKSLDVQLLRSGAFLETVSYVEQE